jgi:hypothetical protein
MIAASGGDSAGQDHPPVAGSAAIFAIKFSESLGLAGGPSGAGTEASAGIFIVNEILIVAA